MTDKMASIDPYCCGQGHHIKDEKFVPVHHEHSVPPGFCEYCNAPLLMSILEQVEFFSDTVIGL